MRNPRKPQFLPELETYDEPTGCVAIIECVMLFVAAFALLAIVQAIECVAQGGQW